MTLHVQRDQALEVHNIARGVKGVGPLQWDSQLAKRAEDYARVLSVKRYLEHDTCDDDAVKAWLGEEPIYNGEDIPNGRFEEYGHYTQCMWADTTRVGMGWAHGLDGMTFIVARYSPAGNIADETPF